MRSDQWPYVALGTGRATVRGRRVGLKPGSLLLIEAGEPHEISNEGGDPSGGHQHLRPAGVLKHLRERRTGFASVLSEVAPAAANAC